MFEFEDRIIEDHDDWSLKAILQTTGFALGRPNHPLLKLVCVPKPRNPLISQEAPMCSYRFDRNLFFGRKSCEPVLNELKDIFDYRTSHLKQVLLPLGFDFFKCGFQYEHLRIDIRADEDQRGLGICPMYLLLQDGKLRMIHLNIVELLKAYAQHGFENLPQEARDALI